MLDVSRVAVVVVNAYLVDVEPNNAERGWALIDPACRA